MGTGVVLQKDNGAMGGDFSVRADSAPLSRDREDGPGLLVFCSPHTPTSHPWVLGSQAWCAALKLTHYTALYHRTYIPGLSPSS